jgi:hypothetical protein
MRHSAGIREANGRRGASGQEKKALIGQGCVFRGGGRVERIRGGGINATTNRKRRDFCGGGKRERNMVADDIIGALGMENETIEGRIDKGAV